MNAEDKPGGKDAPKPVIWVPTFLTAAAAIAGLIFTGLSLRATEQGQITDRYDKAVSQLGSSDPYVHVGGIYALERIAHDSPADQPTIVQVLSTYMQGRAAQTSAGDCDRQIMSTSSPAIDAHAAFTVLARRDPANDGGATVRVPGLCLPGVIAPRAQLRDSELSHVTLTAAVLVDSDFHNANLTNAVIGCRDMRVAGSCANLRRSDLTDASLTNAALMGCDLQQTHLDNATLVGADLTRANLIQSTMIGVHMVHAQFDQANMQDTTITRAELSGAHLVGAQLSGADLSESDFSGSDLTGATLFSTRIANGRLAGATLTNAVLVGADLSGADLAGANLTGANLSHANLTGTNLSGANLTSVTMADATGVQPR